MSGNLHVSCAMRLKKNNNKDDNKFEKNENIFIKMKFHNNEKKIEYKY